MKKIPVGVVGAGYLGKFHARKYAALENAELVAVVDIDRERAETVAKETNGKPFARHSDIFGIVEAVSIVTPTETHHEIGRGFLSRGIDVLIEKPLASTVKEAASLVEEAEKTGAILQVGHLERFNPAVVALMGKVKNPLFIESHRLAPFSPRSLDVDVVSDLMIHDIDIILNLVGADVASLDALGAPVISDKVDIANARIKFRNGCVADITASRVSKEKMRKIRLFQEDAYISIDYTHQRISISKLVKRGAPAAIEHEEIDMEKKDTLEEELKSFIECCTKRTAPLVGGRDGLKALQVAELVSSAIEATRSAMGCGKTL